EAAIAEIPNTLAVFLCVRRSVASAARHQQAYFSLREILRVFARNFVEKSKKIKGDFASPFTYIL
ncbi:MAG: hypothetical protein ABJB86_06205, partial [Bacteroidota bacterium]